MSLTEPIYLNSYFYKIHFYIHEVKLTLCGVPRPDTAELNIMGGWFSSIPVPSNLEQHVHLLLQGAECDYYMLSCPQPSSLYYLTWFVLELISPFARSQQTSRFLSAQQISPRPAPVS